MDKGSLVPRNISTGCLSLEDARAAQVSIKPSKTLRGSKLFYSELSLFFDSDGVFKRDRKSGLCGNIQITDGPFLSQKESSATLFYVVDRERREAEPP